ncbi:thymidylate synthase [Pseudovibrio ascidiaceicola]|uniref:thymidylate synthase n=1 Tax=Pseudovibrio ascidiaceicola TaxID=285279 RepID=UPI000D688854|nr:thymidylate synthase [Pseudovibrio ascidiaceicola]
MYSYENLTFAAAASIRDLLSRGELIEVRGSQVLELRNRVTTLRKPTERCLFLPKRGNDPFAAIAETLWVLAGKDQVDWLEEYLPRAKQFSDDKVRWRGAYGPRLRNWQGNDQLKNVLGLLGQDRNSRRATMSLFDPAIDYVDTLDVPCTNWLSWILRDDKLHLIIGMRSNDVWWGFSGINAFEWSVLQQMMAHWLGVSVGDMSFVATSFHLYERHFKCAQNVTTKFSGMTCYQHGLSPPEIKTPFEKLDAVLEEVFSIEQGIRRDFRASFRKLEDPFFDICLQVLQLRQAYNQKACVKELSLLISKIPDCDLKAAAVVWLLNREKRLLNELDTGPVKSFVSAYVKEKSKISAVDEIAEAVKALHKRKDAAYGISWKKRGEVRSIIPNIARKIDRLEEYNISSVELKDEAVIDTVIDLIVYIIKYHLFLIQKGGAFGGAFAKLTNSKANLSDGTVAFDDVIHAILQSSSKETDVSSLIDSCSDIFNQLDAAVHQRDRDNSQVNRLIDMLLKASVSLLHAFRGDNPEALSFFVAQERESL